MRGVSNPQPSTKNEGLLSRALLRAANRAVIDPLCTASLDHMFNQTSLMEQTKVDLPRAVPSQLQPPSEVSVEIAITAHQPATLRTMINIILSVVSIFLMHFTVTLTSNQTYPFHLSMSVSDTFLVIDICSAKFRPF